MFYQALLSKWRNEFYEVLQDAVARKTAHTRLNGSEDKSPGLNLLQL